MAWSLTINFIICFHFQKNNSRKQNV